MSDPRTLAMPPGFCRATRCPRRAPDRHDVPCAGPGATWPPRRRSVRWPSRATWAGPACHGLWRMRSEQCDRDPASAAWVTGIVWDERQSLAVGAAGFHGPPDSDGMVEIGYRIDPVHLLGLLAMRARLSRPCWAGLPGEPDVRRCGSASGPTTCPRRAWRCSTDSSRSASNGTTRTGSNSSTR